MLRHHSFVKLLLMSAERAWAAAMAMKSAQSRDDTQSRLPGSTRRQIVSKLSKAIQYAQHLISCIRGKAAPNENDMDEMEAAAYLASFRGSLHFEKGRWDSCIQEYSVARVVYAALGSATSRDLFKDLLSSTIDPCVRYAAYQLRLPRTKAVSDIAIERFPLSESEIQKKVESINPNAFVSSEKAEIQGQTLSDDIPSTISWRQRAVKVEDARIAQAIAVANRKELELSQTHKKADLATQELAAAYDDVINARQEAVDATKSALDELMTEGVDTGDSRVQSLQLTGTAVKYAVIELRIGRNRVLCGARDGVASDRTGPKRGRTQKKNSITQAFKDESTGTKLARLRERVAQYDAILQNIDEVKELSGVAGDLGFLDELSGKRAYFRALKYVIYLCSQDTC